jgi:EAL domain-containing protein (putative c-di-GMP-specific phosphodiesterase class I)
VDDSGMSPESMIMELTESGYLEDSPAVKRVWSHLKNYGVSIALDDFGTGYSNLQSIGNLTPNVVKLDRGFTLKALKNDYENQVMRYVIEMVHSLDLKICVEGIETQEELDRIRLLSPDYIQGYYYGKPCSMEEFLRNFVHAA